MRFHRNIGFLHLQLSLRPNSFTRGAFPSPLSTDLALWENTHPSGKWDLFSGQKKELWYYSLIEESVTRPHMAF